jgi:hypothetical protein
MKIALEGEAIAIAVKAMRRRRRRCQAAVAKVARQEILNGSIS